MVREMVEKREGIGSEAAAAAVQARWSIGPSLGKEMGAARAELLMGRGTSWVALWRRMDCRDARKPIGRSSCTAVIVGLCTSRDELSYLICACLGPRAQQMLSTHIPCA